jgi:hypothetical protein
VCVAHTSVCTDQREREMWLLGVVVSNDVNYIELVYGWVVCVTDSGLSPISTMLAEMTNLSAYTDMASDFAGMLLDTKVVVDEGK